MNHTIRILTRNKHRCGACRYIKPQFRDAASALQDDPTIQFFTIDATEEIALALQFDVTRYPLILLIQDGNVYEWKQSISLVDFATASSPPASLQWNQHLGPFSYVGTCKYYIGSAVQALIEFYHDQTDFLSNEWKTAWILAAIAVFVSSVLMLVFLTTPSETKARID